MWTRGLLSLAIVLPLLAAACHHRDDDDDVDFVETVPSGGVDFGLFQQFEHDFADLSIADSQDLDGFEFSLAEDSTILIAVTGVGGFDGFVDLYSAGFSFRSSSFRSLAKKASATQSNTPNTRVVTAITRISLR